MASGADKAYRTLYKFIQSVRFDGRLSGAPGATLRAVVALNALELLGERLRLTKAEEEAQDMRSGEVGANLPPLP